MADDSSEESYDPTEKWSEDHEKYLSGLRKHIELFYKGMPAVLWVVKKRTENRYESLDQRKLEAVCNRLDAVQDSMKEMFMDTAATVGQLTSYRTPVLAMDVECKNDLRSVCEDALQMRDGIKPALQALQSIQTKECDEKIESYLDSMSAFEKRMSEDISNVTQSLQTLENLAEKLKL